VGEGQTQLGFKAGNSNQAALHRPACFAAYGLLSQRWGYDAHVNTSSPWTGPVLATGNDCAAQHQEATAPRCQASCC
jgi:hypothetical protein